MGRYIGRRTFLAATASLTGALSSSGCITINSGQDSKFRLTTYHFDRGLSELVKRPDEIRSQFVLDYTDEYKREKMEELVETGTVSTRGWGLSYLVDWGRTTRQNHDCLLYDGTYYRPIVESSEEISRDTWVFYVDWNADDPFNQNNVATYPVETLSKQDRRIHTTAVERVPHASRRNGFDHGPAVQYHAELDPSASELVPEPPFDYLQTEEETFRAVAERIPVTKPERTITATPVAESRSEFEAFARAELVDANFSEVELSGDAQSIVEQVTDPLGTFDYEEEPPLSDGLEEVLEELGIAQHLQSHEEYDDFTDFNGAIAASPREQWFEFDLKIYP